MSVEKLIKYVNATNIAEKLDDGDLHEIAENCRQGFTIDEDSCQSWIDMNKKPLE